MFQPSTPPSIVDVNRNAENGSVSHLLHEMNSRKDSAFHPVPCSCITQALFVILRGCARALDTLKAFNVFGLQVYRPGSDSNLLRTEISPKASRVVAVKMAELSLQDSPLRLP